MAERDGHDGQSRGRGSADFGAARRSRRQRFGFAGWFYLGTTIIIALGGVNSQNNLLFLAFGVAIAGLLLSGMVGGTSILNVRAERVLPAEAIAGEPMAVRYRVRNSGRVLPSFCLTFEELPDAPGRDESPEVRRSRRQAERNGESARFAAPPLAAVLHVGPGEGLTAEGLAAPARRGMLKLDRFVVHSRFPFGLIRKIVEFSQPQRLLVHPAQLAVRRDVLRLPRRGGQSGLDASARVGRGEELFGVREYVPGDSPRDIAWRASARSSNLLVREWAAPRPLRLWIVLTVRPGDDATHAETAIALAASIVRMAASREDLAVGLAAPGVGLLSPPRSARSARGPLLNALAMIDLTKPHESANEEKALSVPARSMVIAIHADEVRASSVPAGATHLLASKPEAWMTPGAPAGKEPA